MMNGSGFGRKRHRPGGTERNQGKPLVGIVCVPAKIRTEHPPNTNLDRNRYVILPGYYYYYY
jgi:hypothetical protein